MAEYHEHHHHAETDKLQQVLPYLLKHSREHIEEIEKWIRLAEEAHQPEVAAEFKKALKLSKEIIRRYKAAAEKMGRLNS